MRVRLDPDRLTTYSLSAAEVLVAVSRNKTPNRPGGQLGDRPLAHKRN